MEEEDEEDEENEEEEEDEEKEEEKRAYNFLLTNFLLYICDKLPNAMKEQLDELNIDWIDHVASEECMEKRERLLAETVIKFAHFRFKDDENSLKLFMSFVSSAKTTPDGISQNLAVVDSEVIKTETTIV